MKTEAGRLEADGEDTAQPPPSIPAQAPPGEAAKAARKRLTVREALSAIGPGLITGGADNDPAGIATYSVVGASAGYSLNWLLFLSTPLLIVVQQMSARVANVTKGDFASIIRTTYGR